MSVIRWNPLREIDEAFARVNQLPGSASERRFTPLADISETDTGYVVELELPGFSAQDVEVTVHDGVLSVSGERKPNYLADVNEEEESQADQPRVHRAERQYGKFERRFRLPKDADIDGVAASAKDGVLTLAIARRAEAARRAIEVKVA